MKPIYLQQFPSYSSASANNRRFHVPQPTFLFPLGTPLWQSRKKRQFSACQTSRNIFKFPSYWNRKCKKSQFPRTAAHIFCFPWRRPPVWYGKTRMAWLPDGEKISKISLYFLAQLTNVTDAQTDRQTDGHRVTGIAALCIASHGKNTVSYRIVSYRRNMVLSSSR